MRPPKITSAEDITLEQIVEFVSHMDTHLSGQGDTETDNMISLGRKLSRVKEQNEVIEKLNFVLTLSSLYSIMQDYPPALICWTMGFVMGVKFSNKELVDHQLEDIK